jgi:hypothetical protein
MHQVRISVGRDDLPLFEEAILRMETIIENAIVQQQELSDRKRQVDAEKKKAVLKHVSSLPSLAKYMPLADVHQHLDAMVSYELLQNFANSKRIVLSQNFMGEKYKARSEEFFRDYESLNNNYIKGKEEYKKLVKDYLIRMSRNGLIYTDIMVSPAHAATSGMGFEEMLEAVNQAIDEATEETGIYAPLSFTAVNSPASPGAKYGPNAIRECLDEFAVVINSRPEIIKYVTSFGVAAP